MVAVAEERPPYVTFELRAVEDRAKSIESGAYAVKDVAFAIITPQGSKDCIERVAEDWFKQLEGQVSQGRFPRAWYDAFRGAFKSWQEGTEPVLNGTDVRNWPAVSPAQVKQLQELRIRTVEDLAGANEETIHRLGMGGRALKQKAQAWLDSAQNTGKQAEAFAALQAENTDLKARCESLEARLEATVAKLEALAPSTPPAQQEPEPLKL